MAASKPTAFRLPEKVDAKLAEMAQLAETTKTQVLITAIETLYERDYKERRTLAEQQAAAGVALVRKVEERLGKAWWREDGVTELSFGLTEDGRVIVLAGEDRYLEHQDGRLLKARVRGGHLVIASIEEDGSLGDPMAMPLGQPALN